MFLALRTDWLCPVFCLHTVACVQFATGRQHRALLILFAPAAAPWLGQQNALRDLQPASFLFFKMFSQIGDEMNWRDLGNGLSGVTASRQTWINNGPVWQSDESLFSRQWESTRKDDVTVRSQPLDQSAAFSLTLISSLKRLHRTRPPAQSLLVGPRHDSYWPSKNHDVEGWSPPEHENPNEIHTERELWSFWPSNPPSGRKNCSRPFHEIILTHRRLYLE